MPTAGYRKVEDNVQVVDVIYALLLQDKMTPQDLAKKLKQNVNTVSSKLFFLRKEGIVKKSKWDYILDKPVLHKAFLKGAKKAMDNYSVSNDIESYFPRDVALGIIKVFAVAYFHNHSKHSIREMISMFIDQMSKMKSDRIRKLNPKLLELKEAVSKMPSLF